MKNGMKVVVLVGSYAGMVGEVVRISGELIEVFFGVNRGKGYIGTWIYTADELKASA